MSEMQDYNSSLSNPAQSRKFETFSYLPPLSKDAIRAQIQYIVDDSDAKIVVFSDSCQWKKIEPIRASLGKVRHFITLEVLHER